MANERDYYADLELPPTADILEIKKQFRKLALKYHPDRNPGKEAEVNAKFQTIQSAHEVLGDPAAKAQYDATRPASRYPAASGVRGNPWANAGSHFPPPPRRNPGGSRHNAPKQPPSGSSASGAQRWQTRFATGHAPTAKQHHAEKEAEVKKNAARAFENMRRNQTQGAPPQPPPRPQPPPPPPRAEPRTESARQRREASFGQRRTGHQPSAASSEDEPGAHRRSHYASASTNRPPEEPITPRKTRPQSMADPLSQFREPASPAEPRLSTPYSSHGGEKTNPFDNGGLNRAKSARARPQADMPASEHPPAGYNKHRSSSVPRSGGERLGDDLKHHAEAPRPNTSDTGAANHAQSSFKARTDSQDAGHASASSADDHRQEPSMYESPSRKDAEMSCSTIGLDATSPDREILISPYPKQSCQDSSKPAPFANTPTASSEATWKPTCPSSLYYKQQHQIIEGLIKNSEILQNGSRTCHITASRAPLCISQSNHLTRSSSFAVPHGGQAADRQTPPDSATFQRASSEDINTSFVEDETQAYTFSAGGERPRAQPRSRKAKPTESPSKEPPEQTTSAEPRKTSEPQVDGAFDPSGWNHQFGPHTFVPPREQSASASPTRTNRKNSRRARNAKLAAGASASAAIILEDSSDDDAFTWQGRKTQTPGGVGSPQAMDIDSPSPQTAEPAPPTATTTQPEETSHPARNVHLEPSRPEWREGETLPSRSPERPPKVPLAGHRRDPSEPHGSEDTAEFQATLDDLKNVAPFANQQEGLTSFGDLKDSLPFESRASTRAPNATTFKFEPLRFPGVPLAPRPPPTAAMPGMTPSVSSWAKYLEDFKGYLGAWDRFNECLTQHFSTRKSNTKAERAADNYGFLGARGDDKVMEYFIAVQQDNDLRRKWNAAWEEHEQRFREFLAFREKMKQAI